MKYTKTIIIVILVLFIVACAPTVPVIEPNMGEPKTADPLILGEETLLADDLEPNDSARKHKTATSSSFSAIAAVNAVTRDLSRSNILIIKESGIAVTLTEGDSKNLRPAISPDGSKIAFYSDMSGNFDIYISSMDGEAIRNISLDDADNYLPQWSPDSNRICYQSYDGEFSNIYIINSDGSAKFKLTQDGTENYGPVWSPEGDKIIYVSNEGGNYNIYSMVLENGIKQRLTHDQYYPNYLSFTPDGGKVLYTAGKIDSTIFEIYVLDLASLDLRRLTDYRSYTSMPLWAEGDIIVFGSDMNGSSQIYSINSDGNGLRNLTRNDYDNYLLGISSDGSSIFYQTFGSDGEAELVMHGLESSERTRVMGGSREFEILKQGNAGPLEMFQFIDLNILIAGELFADHMIDFVLEYSENGLHPLSEKYYRQDIQDKLCSVYGGTTDLNVLAESADKRIAELAKDTINGKYKLISFEKIISPVVDYGAYRRYGAYLSDQMNAYLDIMAKESESPSLMDGKIIISLEEYVRRIMEMYVFEQKYPGFVRIYRIANMLNLSLGVYMGGVEGTPVFDSKGEVLPHRLEDFKRNAELYQGTRFGEKLAEYIKLLESENYKKTCKVGQYIENLVFY